jgi:hypothetical protein
LSASLSVHLKEIGGRRTGAAAAPLFLAFLLVVAVFSLGSLSTAHAETLGAWNQTTSLPTSGVAGCVASGGYDYCIYGGLVYYGQLTSSGVASWTATTSYPAAAESGGQTCAASGGYIYCVGGFPATGTMPTDNTYYAAATASGVGAWTATSDYSIGIAGASCTISAGQIYCLGGEETVGAVQTDLTAYAPVSSSGIGTWTATTTYPQSVVDPNRVTSTSYIYCAGGEGPSGGMSPSENTTYYAPLSASGIGTWTAGPIYPSMTSGYGTSPYSCVASGGYMYCIGAYYDFEGDFASSGEVNYALISSSGIGTWTAATAYPGTSSSPDACATSGGYIYCNGGEGNTSSSSAVYYSQIAAPTTSSVAVDSQNQAGTAITGYYVALYGSSGSVAGSGFTPDSFPTTVGAAYTLQADGYGSCTFSAWSNGATMNPLPFTATSSPLTLTAVYDCGTVTAPSSVTVDSVNQAGTAITGYYVALLQGGSVVASGFSPQTFPTTSGDAYSVRADGYGSCTFSHWSNGATTDPMPFTATSGALTLTADYDCAGTVGTTSTIHVSTVNGAGTAISGYYITLWQGGAFVTSCFSACSFTVNDGQTYQVAASSYGAEAFSHWQNDGSTGLETVVVPSASTTISLTAVYSP